MTRAEARQFFEWFVSQSASRQKILSEYMRETGGDCEKLDYTPESLVSLWAWAVAHVQARRLTGDEIEALSKSTPSWFKDVDHDNRELTEETISISVDVGYYLAEVFLRRYPRLKWGLWTKGKKSYDYHRPVIRGIIGGKYEIPLDPSGIVQTCAWHAIRGKHNIQKLYEIYKFWSENHCFDSQSIPS